MKNKRVVITGGAGFIGSNLSQKLLSDNEVIIIDDVSTGRIENIQTLVETHSVNFARGSILDTNLLQKTFRGVDFIFHQAAIPSVTRSVKNPALSNEVNITGTLNVLIAARDNNVKKVVFASSSSVYGDTPTLPKNEEMYPNPQSPYALTKFVGENYCRLFTSIFGLSTVCLRYFNVYGPKQNPYSEYAAVIPKFILNIKADKPPVIFGDGNQTRDFTFVEDVVAANILAAESDVNGVFNIGSGNNTTITGLAESIARILNSNIKPTYLPKRPGDVKDSLADITKAASWGYKVKFALEIGLQETIRRFSN